MHKNVLEAIRSALPEIDDKEAERICVAVLKALREPNTLMLRNAAKCLTYTHRPELRYLSAREKHKVRFQAMIDGAMGLDVENRREREGS